LHRHELCTEYGREGNRLSRAVVDKLSQRHFEVTDGTDTLRTRNSEQLNK
jgi:hypothetical protein